MMTPPSGSTVSAGSRHRYLARTISSTTSGGKLAGDFAVTASSVDFLTDGHRAPPCGHHAPRVATPIHAFDPASPSTDDASPGSRAPHHQGGRREHRPIFQLKGPGTAGAPERRSWQRCTVADCHGDGSLRELRPPSTTVGAAASLADSGRYTAGRQLEPRGCLHVSASTVPNRHPARAGQFRTHTETGRADCDSTAARLPAVASGIAPSRPESACLQPTRCLVSCIYGS